MNKNNEVKNEKLIPSAAIVNQKLAILEKMNAALDANDPDAANVQLALSEELDAKYTFFDQVFDEEGKKGLKDVTGKIRVPARFADFCETYHLEHFRKLPVGAMNEEGKCALVTTDGIGTALTPFEFDNIHFAKVMPYFVVTKGEKEGFIQPDGTEVVPCILDSWSFPFNGFTSLEADGKFGLITDWGVYVAPVYDEMDEKDEMPYVRKGDTWGFLDLEGNFVDENDPELDNIDLLDFFMAVP